MAKQVVKTETTDKMRYLMRLNAEIGTAKKADVKGYYIGGKTGTSEKVVNGRYSKKQVLNSFTAIMPADNPQYQLLIMLDEPKALPETHGFITSGWNAVPTGGKVIARIAPLLGIEPRFDLPPSDRLILAASKDNASKRVIARRSDEVAPRPDWKIMILRDLFSDDARSTAGADAVAVRGLAVDSRAVKPGDLFFALAGSKTDGARFIDAAIAAGAVAIAGEHPPPRPLAVPFVSRRKSAPRAGACRGEDFIRASPAPSRPSPAPAARRRSPPSRARSGSGSATRPPASAPSGWCRRSATVYGSLTTPDPIALHRQLDEIAGDGVTHLAFEASSHGLDQYRLDGVRIAAGGFTNLFARPHGLSSRRRALSQRQAAPVPRSRDAGRSGGDLRRS